MREGITGLLLTLALLGTSFAPQGVSGDAAVATQLRANDELLLRGVHSGDRATWERLTTPDFIYVEEGEITPRAELLKELEPDGQEPLKISTYDVQVSGDLALVVHRDDVPSEPGDTRPAGQYLMTETWQRLNGVWKLHIVHLDSIRTDPPAVALSVEQMDRLAGTYRYKSYTFTIRREGGRLLGLRSGASEKELKAETRDVLFTPGDLRQRKVFVVDAAGDVTGFIRRDENSDVLRTNVK